MEPENTNYDKPTDYLPFLPSLFISSFPSSHLRCICSLLPSLSRFRNLQKPYKQRKKTLTLRQMSGAAATQEEEKKPMDQSAHINLKVKGQVRFSLYKIFLFWCFFFFRFNLFIHLKLCFDSIFGCFVFLMASIRLCNGLIWLTIGCDWIRLASQRL